MGILKKIFKGVKKVFKKIGKAIKRAFKKVGKFMGKLGILGQIGLTFLLPGLGGLLGKAATFLGSSSSALLQGVGRVLQTAVNFGKTAGKVFNTITDAVGGFVKEVGGGFLSKMGVSDATLAKFGLNPEGGFQSWMDGIGKSVGAVRESAAGIFDPFKKDALGLDFNQRSILSRAADSVADVVPASSSEAAFQAIDEAASGSLMGTPQTTGSLSEYIKRPDLENVVPAFDLEASIKAFDEAARAKPLTTDSLSKYIKRPKEVGGYPVNEAMLKPEGLNPAEAVEAVFEETAKGATEKNESFLTSFMDSLKDQVKQVPGKIGSNVISSLETAGTNYINQQLGIMPQTEQVQTASGGLAYTSGVDYSLQSSPFMSTFTQGMVNTNYNALFDQIYSYQPRGYA